MGDHSVWSLDELRAEIGALVRTVEELETELNELRTIIGGRWWPIAT